MKETTVRPTIKEFEDIVQLVPGKLRALIVELIDVDQHPVHHPEGSVFNHTRIVTQRAINAGYDRNVVIAAFFHDLGKGATQGVNDETGYPTAYGHERVSEQLVQLFANTVRELGADPDVVAWLVRQHMRYKKLDVMRAAKRKRLLKHEWFDLLEQLGSVDRGGTDV